MIVQLDIQVVYKKQAEFTYKTLKGPEFFLPYRYLHLQASSTYPVGAPFVEVRTFSCVVLIILHCTPDVFKLSLPSVYPLYVHFVPQFEHCANVVADSSQARVCFWYENTRLELHLLHVNMPSTTSNGFFDELVNLMELVVEIVKDGMSPSDLAAAQPF